MEATYEEAKKIVEDKLINKTEYRTYEELSEILFGDGNCFNESEVRKRMYGMKRMIELHDKYESNSTPNNDVIEIQLAKRELEAAKVQFRDERAAWNRQNTIDARVNQKLDYLETVLKESGERMYIPSPVEVCVGNSDNDLLVILSDLHIGAAFSSEWGEYNPDIATRRLNQYIREIVKIADRHNSENCFVSIQGDLISGSIHKSIQVTNRENVIDQIKIAANLITDFCFELSNYFKKVTITNVSGNHSRIDKKEDAIHSERLDDLIGWIVKNSLSHINKITFKENNLDIGIASIDIRGKEYIAVHGDYDSYSPSGVSSLCMMIHRIPYAILYGHLHHCSVDEVNGVKMVRGGSLAGSGDAFTIEKRLSGKPSQMVCVCSSSGIEAYYPVELN
ncbi:hypothetical protein ACTND3_03050 [Bacillota bacterium HCP28S3_F12]